MNPRFCGRCGSGLTSSSCVKCTPSALRTAPAWTCACGYLSNTPTCAHCGAFQQFYEAWSCNCGYQRNSTPTCCMCGQLRGAQPAMEARQFAVQITVKAGMWVCSECGFDRNWAEFNTCKMCKQLNSIGKYIRQS